VCSVSLQHRSGNVEDRRPASTFPPEQLTPRFAAPRYRL